MSAIELDGISPVFDLGFVELGCGEGRELEDFFGWRASWCEEGGA